MPTSEEIKIPFMYYFTCLLAVHLFHVSSSLFNLKNIFNSFWIVHRTNFIIHTNLLSKRKTYQSLFNAEGVDRIFF